MKHIRFDWAVKRLLRNKANFVVLEGFLSELIGEIITIQQILDSESNKKTWDDKYNRVDILVQNTKKQLFLIEVQNEREYDYFHRMSYGQAKALSEHLKEGARYANLLKVFSISIVYFDLGQGDDYLYLSKGDFRGIHTGSILNLSGKQKELYGHEHVSDIFTTYYLIKVNNFNDTAKDSIDEWIYFLKNNEIKDEFKARGLQEAKEILRVDNLSNKERKDYNRHLENLRYEASRMETIKADEEDRIRTEERALVEERIRTQERALAMEAIMQAQQREAEAQQREAEAQQREVEAQQREAAQEEKLKNGIRKLYQKGVEIIEIAETFEVEADYVRKLIN